MSRYASLMVVVSVATCAFNPSYAIEDGTYVAGEALYRDTKSQDLMPARGAELHLIASHHDKAPPDTYRRLDVDYSSSDISSAGLFVLGTSEVHGAVTILYYPWRHDREERSAGFLPKVVTTKRLHNDRTWRAKLRLHLTPTDASLTTARTLGTALKDAWFARDASIATDVNKDVAARHLQVDFQIIASMVPPELRPNLVPQVLDALRRDEEMAEIRWADFEKEIELAFHPKDADLDNIKRQQIEWWEAFRQKRNFNE